MFRDPRKSSLAPVHSSRLCFFSRSCVVFVFFFTFLRGYYLFFPSCQESGREDRHTSLALHSIKLKNFGPFRDEVR